MAIYSVRPAINFYNSINTVRKVNNNRANSDSELEGEKTERWRQRGRNRLEHSSDVCSSNLP